jgi:cytochrome P450
MSAAVEKTPSLALSRAPIGGAVGWPLVGHTWSVVYKTHDFLERMRQTHGENFRASAFGWPVLFVGGAQEAREILVDTQKNFSSFGGWDLTLGKLFKQGLMLRDFEEHRFHRKLMQAAFRTGAMQNYVREMSVVAAEALDKWPSEIPAYGALKQLTLDMAARIFAGVTLGDQVQALNRDFVDVVKATTSPLKWQIPGSSFARGMRARQRLDAFFRARIASSRAGEGVDMFAELCRAKDERGEHLSDDDIVNHMIFLMMAAHDTTTSALTTLVGALAREPAWQARAREEVQAAESVTYAERDAFALLDACFHEALRMYPPVPFVMRRSLDACRIGALDIPKNTQIAVTSLITHRSPVNWENPNMFDAERFMNGKLEAAIKAHTFFPFGSGAHTCIGLHVARVQVKVIMHALLRRFRVSLASESAGKKMLYVPMPMPLDGLPVRLERL